MWAAEVARLGAGTTVPVEGSRAYRAGNDCQPSALDLISFLLRAFANRAWAVQGKLSEKSMLSERLIYWPETLLALLWV